MGPCSGQWTPEHTHPGLGPLPPGPNPVHRSPTTHNPTAVGVGGGRLRGLAITAVPMARHWANQRLCGVSAPADLRPPRGGGGVAPLQARPS